MPVYFHQSKNLPSEYQEVEYIQSSWTQYIIIWTSFKTSYKTVIDFQMTVIWGDYIPFWIKYDTTRYWIDAYNSKFMVNGWGEIWNNTISEDTNRHTITIDKGTAIVDWNNYSVSYTNYTFSKWIWVFCYNEYDKSPQYTYKSSNKLYKLDIYDENWTHIYDLVPCYRKSDSVIWLYDLVNNQFYTNSWSWTFSKWSNVSNDHTIENLSRLYIWDELIVWGECWYQFKWQLDLISNTFWHDCPSFLTDIWWEFLSISSNHNSSAAIYWMVIGSDWTILRTNSVSSPIRYSWDPSWSFHPINKTVFLRSEWDWWVYNYNTDNLTIWSLVMNYWSWYWNSYAVSSDWRLISYWWNEANTSQKYIIVNWTSYWSMNNRPFWSWSWNARNMVDAEWHIYVTLRNSLSVYKCRVDDNYSLQYVKIGDMASWYDADWFRQTTWNIEVFLSTSWFQIMKDDQISQTYSFPRNRNYRRWVWAWNYICILDVSNNNWWTDVYVFKTDNLTTPIYTTTIAWTSLNVWTHPSLNWFVLSQYSKTYFLH